MKKFRILNLVFWTILALACCIGVSIAWYNQGCPIQSLVIACVYYTATCAGLCGVIDYSLQGK